MKYHDFRIRIEAKRGNGYDVSVNSPAGSANEHIVLPFDIDEAMQQFHDMGRAVRGASDRKVVMEGPAPVKPSEFGNQLFRALFTGRVGKLYNAMSRDLQDPNVGLRINLHLNLNDPSVSALAGVPWEFVYDADTMDYLNLSKQTPIIRYLDVQRPNTLQPLSAGKLKVLAVMSSPKGMHELDLDKERKLIETIMARDKEIELTIKEHPTPNKLRLWLTQDEYHVLHYMGHGTHDDKTGVGALVLEDEDNNAVLLDAETLGTFLRNAPTVRLAFLNACDLAKTDEDSPFSGVANRLVMAGMPAVVAMQFPISDDAAIAFARSFYARLESGHAVDEAVAHGRNAILADKPGSMEWGTPVLYMRTPDGRLFEKPRKARAELSAPKQPVPVPVADGTVAVTKKAIGTVAGIAAAVLAVVAGIFFWTSGRSVTLDFDVTASDALTAYIDVPKRLIVGPKEGDGGSQHLARYTVDIAAPAGVTGVTVGETSIINDVWQADLTAGNEGEFEILATISDKNKPNADPLKKSVTMGVTIEPAVQTDYDSAIASIKEPGNDTESIVAELTRLEALGLSDEMRETLVSTKEQLDGVVQAKSLARGTFDSATIMLTEKIGAYDDWFEGLKSVRGFEPTATDYPEVIEEYDDVRNAITVTDFTLCASRPPCSAGVRFRAGTTVFEVISHTPDVKTQGVFVRYLLKPDLELIKLSRFKLAGNTTSIGGSALSKRGSYEVRLFNDDGDLLKSQEIEIH
ncbi:MAG: CHAT domain-containing protein [Gammaproteobacteria bacterium]|nr:CHAT domain-containing protein [Gammaproteobacteria bacterium]MDH3767403.1 CHAT domain-containing protein [Gammaproteobacteria bacterium]